jgi:hypothetical protein
METVGRIESSPYFPIFCSAAALIASKAPRAFLFCVQRHYHPDPAVANDDLVGSASTAHALTGTDKAPYQLPNHPDCPLSYRSAAEPKAPDRMIANWRDWHVTSSRVPTQLS